MRTRTVRLGMATTLVVSATISACSGSVDTSANAGASASGAGGSTAATATATSSTGQGGGAFCGGEAGIQCAPGQFCAFDPPGSCGNFDSGGHCTPAPNGCTDDCPGVCGCNGNFYCNACDAHAAGFDVSSSPSGSCLPDAGSSAIYSGQEIFTNVSRFAIFKADPARDVCFRLVLEMLGGGGGPLGITTPAGWSIGMAEVTDHASDCVGGANGYPDPPIGKAMEATGGSGKIDFPASGQSCFISIHATLSFPKGAPFVPANEPLDADMVAITGACPP